MHLRCLWVAAVVTLRYAAAVPKATPTPSTPVQLSTYSNDAKFLVLTYDPVTSSLVFAPPTNYFWILKQTWRDTVLSSLAYVSLEVRLAGFVGQSSTKTFITRTPGTLLRIYGANETFASYQGEDRLMSSKCCSCGSGMSPTSFYWSSGNSNVQTTILSATASQVAGDFMVLNSTKVTGGVSCPTSGLNILTYPYVEITPESSLHRRKRTADAYRTQLIFDYGISSDVVIALETDSGRTLSLVPYKENACKKETWFYYTAYKEYRIDSSGRLVEERCLTLQHVASGDYVVADVSDDILLNAGPGQSGLVLQNASLFDDEVTPNFPDYRFFSLKTTVLPISVNSSLTIQNMCPFFHRRYCMRANYFNGSLELSPVVDGDSSGAPTFEDLSLTRGLPGFFYRTPAPRGGTPPKFNGFPTGF